ncbi:MAG TPA: hypothetical protein VKW06_07860 [Candidatus Angelobacter sp.]|nr:hypothetical protein [Candidatus Angelobacter sp.]
MIPRSLFAPLLHCIALFASPAPGWPGAVSTQLTNVTKGIDTAAAVAEVVTAAAPPDPGESNVQKIVGEAAGIASLFVKSNPAVAALSEAAQLSPIFIHLGFFIAHLFHHAVKNAAPVAPAPPSAANPTQVA